MSRGPGKIQRAILDEVQENGQVPFNRLCWDIAFREGKVGPIRQGPCGLRAGELDRAFFQAFARAARALAEDGKIELDERKLGTPAEVEKYYPYRTHELWVLELRKQLLPIVRKVAEKAEGRKFSAAENELHLIDRLDTEDLRASRKKSTDAGKLAEFKRKWQTLEPSIFKLLGNDGNDRSDTERRDALFYVLVKGRQIFGQSSAVSSPKSLGECIEILRGLTPRLPEEDRVYPAVCAFYDECFPSRDVAHVELKTRLYEVVNFGSHGGAHLHHDFKMHLYREAPQIVSQMPGFRPPPPPPSEHKRLSLDWWVARQDHDDEPTFDRRLNKLISRDVLHNFVFLKRPSPPGTAARAFTPNLARQ